MSPPSPKCAWVSPSRSASPIPNYTCYVADDNLNLLPWGSEGELLIGGPGVARGYLKRDELTAEKFVANPFGGEHDPILYRSGDAVALDANGDILFRGRIDDQVKIRGFRVELGEIETKLAALADVGQAAVVLRNDNGLDQLVAFLVPAKDAAPDAKALRTALRAELPTYMIPARFEIAQELPRLSSGKLDRKTLKARELSVIEVSAEAQEEPRTDTETKLLEAAKAVLPPQAIPFDADFFTDLGGHSLLAAKFISILRQTPALASVTLQDVYAARSLRRLGEVIDDRAHFTGGATSSDLSFTPPPFMRRFLCGAAQAVALVFIFGLVTIQWLGLFLSTILIIDRELSFLQELMILPVVYVIINLAVKFTVIALKWVVIGRTKPGVYPLWGVYYYRLWLVERLTQVHPGQVPAVLAADALVHARHGCENRQGRDDRRVRERQHRSHRDWRQCLDRPEVQVRQHRSHRRQGVRRLDHHWRGRQHRQLRRAEPRCGDRYGRRAEGSLRTSRRHSVIPDAEIWDGSPARKTGMVDVAALPPVAEASKLRRATHAVIYSISYIVMLMFGLLPIFPAFYVLYNLDAIINGVNDYDISWAMLPVLAWPTALVLVIVSMAMIVAVRWLVLPRVNQVQEYLDWSASHAATGRAGRPWFLDAVDGHSRLDRMEEALRACTLWLWLDLRFPGVYGYVAEVVGLRQQLNDGIERQLKGKRPLAQVRTRGRR